MFSPGILHANRSAFSVECIEAGIKKPARPTTFHWLQFFVLIAEEESLCEVIKDSYSHNAAEPIFHLAISTGKKQKHPVWVCLVSKTCHAFECESFLRPLWGYFHVNYEYCILYHHKKSQIIIVKNPNWASIGESSFNAFAQVSGWSRASSQKGKQKWRLATCRPTCTTLKSCPRAPTWIVENMPYRSKTNCVLLRILDLSLQAAWPSPQTPYAQRGATLWDCTNYHLWCQHWKVNTSAQDVARNIKKHRKLTGSWTRFLCGNEKIFLVKARTQTPTISFTKSMRFKQCLLSSTNLDCMKIFSILWLVSRERIRTDVSFWHLRRKAKFLFESFVAFWPVLNWNVKTVSGQFTFATRVKERQTTHRVSSAETRSVCPAHQTEI